MELVRLLLRNTLRHKLRSLLTVVGVGVAVMAFGLLQTVVTAWYAGVEASAANRLITRHAVSFVFPLPLAYRDRIAQVPGVNKVTYAAWFSGVYIDKDQFFARLAVDSDTFFDVYPEFLIPREQFESFRRERNACIIGIDLARRYDLEIGDIMPMEGDVFPGQWEFVVRGIYEPRDQTTDPSTMMFHYKYLDERVRQDSPDRAARLVGISSASPIRTTRRRFLGRSTRCSPIRGPRPRPKPSAPSSRIFCLPPARSSRP
jgi:putative ABC transport system permease protein